MGIKLYPSLLIECDSNDSCDDYKVGSVYVQSKDQYKNISLMNAVMDFNSVIRNNRDILSSIDSISSETTGQSKISAELYSKFTTVVDSTKNALSGLREKIFLGIDQALDKITEINSASVDSLSQMYSTYQRENFLNKALARADISELSVRITDIACSSKLLQGSFPDFGLLRNVQLDHVSEACKYYTRGYNESADIEDIKIFANNDKEKLEIISTRDDEDYDKTAPMKSSLFMAERSFGDKAYHDTELSCELYKLACDNLEHSPRISQYISNRKVQYDDAFSRFLKCIDTVADSIYATFSKPDIDTNVSIEESYSDISTNIGRVFDTCLSSMQNIINSNVILFSHKVNKFISVLQSSCRVKTLAHLLIQKYLPVVVNYDSNNADRAAYSNEDTSYDEVEDIVEECAIITSILSESYLEHSFNTSLTVLLEEEEKKDEKKDDKEKKDEKKDDKKKDDDVTEGGKYSKFFLFRWIKKLWEAIKNFFEKLFGKEEGSATKATAANSANAKLWNEIKADFEKGEWLEKDIPPERKNAIHYRNIKFDKIDVDCFIEFDPKGDLIQKRNEKEGGYKKKLEDAILEKLGYKPDDSPNAKQETNFGKKLEAAYGSAEIPEAELQNWTKFSDIPDLKEKLKTIVEFIQISFDTNSQYPNKYNVSKLHEQIGKAVTNFNNEYEQYRKKLDGVQTETEKKKEEEQQAKSESAIISEDEDSFNLAECLGLYQNDIRVLFEDDNEKKDEEKKEEEPKYQVTKYDLNEKELYDLNQIWYTTICKVDTTRSELVVQGFNSLMTLVREVAGVLKNIKSDAYNIPSKFTSYAQKFQYVQVAISKFSSGWKETWAGTAAPADGDEKGVPFGAAFPVDRTADPSGQTRKLDQQAFNNGVATVKKFITDAEKPNSNIASAKPLLENLLKVLETPVEETQQNSSDDQNATKSNIDEITNIIKSVGINDQKNIDIIIKGVTNDSKLEDAYKTVSANLEATKNAAQDKDKPYWQDIINKFNSKIGENPDRSDEPSTSIKDEIYKFLKSTNVDAGGLEALMTGIKIDMSEEEGKKTLLSNADRLIHDADTENNKNGWTDFKNNTILPNLDNIKTETLSSINKRIEDQNFKSSAPLSSLSKEDMDIKKEITDIFASNGNRNFYITKNKTSTSTREEMMTQIDKMNEYEQWVIKNYLYFKDQQLASDILENIRYAKKQFEEQYKIAKPAKKAKSTVKKKSSSKSPK